MNVRSQPLYFNCELEVVTDGKMAPHLLTYVTYLLTVYSRVLLAKLTGFQLVKKFPSFYGT
jgi:hypothetical protein